MKSDAIVGALKQAAALDVDVDEALDQLTALVETAHTQQVKLPDVILSEVPVGFADKTCVVGWDTCGACHKTLKGCACKNGPTEPSYVKLFRQGSKMDQPEVQSEAVRTTTPVTEVEAETSLPRSSGEDVPSDKDTIPSRVCKDCGQDTMVTEGDEYDDGTFHCFPCQTKET